MLKQSVRKFHPRKIAGHLKRLLTPPPAPAEPIDPAGPMFISADIEVSGGKTAAELLKQKNDSRYLETDRGITKVDRDRWREAQKYEKRTWMVSGAELKDDRNLDHFHHFGDFEALRDKKFGSVIELGCGPFTNLRLLLDQIDAGSVELLDPLIESYLNHANCTYKSGQLNGHPVKIHASSIEDFRPEGTHDLVVMINVIEHCFDAEAVLDRTLQLLPAGGYFVFHDKLYTPDSIKPEQLYDAGHPLRVRGELIKDWLGQNFRPVFERTVAEEHDHSGEGHDHDHGGAPSYYFIGTKLVT